MPRLVVGLGLKSNPFEHYVAEKEPEIADYAVKPPYFEAIEARASNASSFILFGDRGAGKSATRLTVFSELWRRRDGGARFPIAVNFIDFSTITDRKDVSRATEENILKEVAFSVIEQVLTWLSTLSEGDRDIFLGAMNADESGLCFRLVRDYYVVRGEGKRERSAAQAMELLNQTAISKGRLWIERRWDAIAKVISNLTDALARSQFGSEKGVGEAAVGLVAPGAKEFDSVNLMRDLVRFVEIFNFSGVIICVDKVDETEATTNSADKTAALIYPVIARVQNLEVRNFGWIFFLWSKVKSVFEGQDMFVRLDKIAHATIDWERDFFRQMLDRRIKYFSDDALSFQDLIDGGVNVDNLINDLVLLSTGSPRELIRLLDVIVREHDIIYSEHPVLQRISKESVEKGCDKYVTDIISTVYGDRLLAQMFRLEKTTFTNRDVQSTFKVNPQSARTRIQSWENAGIVKFSGTRAAEGTQGGKPAYEYTISDARIDRVMRRRLISYGPLVTEESDDLEMES